MEPRNEKSPFGDYLPEEILSEDDFRRVWLARQESVGRSVLIEELKASSDAERETFLAGVRAKAAIEHPLVASIYEASSDSETCFYAYELLPGKNVRELAAAHKAYKALDFVHLLRRLAEANLYQESHGNATSPLGPENIFIDAQGVLRIDNLAIAGEREEQDSTRDVVALGQFFQDLLDHNHPGTTRCLTLLAWMRGEEVEEPLSWEKVHHYCEQIEQQLTESSDLKAPPTAQVRTNKFKQRLWIFGVLLVVIVGALFLTRDGEAPEKSSTKPGWVEIGAGSYTAQDGNKFSIEPFQISAHEVTIGEYADFLMELRLLADGGIPGIYDHSQQPSMKPDHQPNDWENLYRSAKRGELWRGRKVELDTPVVGVDWWDAYAYCKWKRGFLPTQEQWLGALMSGGENPSAIPVSEWLPVTDETPDRTSKGILGLAGSVSEWTSESRLSPSNPFGAPQWVIIGGSYLKPGQAALTREWVDNRSIRRPDLGFRICIKSSVTAQ